MRFLVLLCLALLPVFALAEERRVALVIGNSAYEHVVRLPNPSNDATDLAAALGRLGFDVDLRIDLGFRDTRLALRDFSARAEGADIALVYYAGHGVEIDRKNYMIPVTAEIKSDRDVEFEAIPLDNILSAVSAAPGLKIVLLDACRNNPFLTTMTRSAATRSIGRGLGRIEPSNIVVGYAARGGTLALDGEGRNSPYARALLDHLEEPGLEFGKMLRKVRDQVFTRTEGLQEPFVYGSLPGEDVFLRPADANTSAVPASDPAQESREADMLEAFEAARKHASLFRWGTFVRDFKDLADHPVYKLALVERETERRKTPHFRLQEIRKRPIWMNGVTIGPQGDVSLTSEQRKLVQEALNMMGYYVGPPDGVFGPRTAAAIRRARSDAGLIVSNEVNADVLKLLPNVYLGRSYLLPKAQRFSRRNLPDDLEARMKTAIEVLERRFQVPGYRFGYFEGSLYVYVLPKHVDFFATNRLARELGGYLAAINSAEENRFLTKLFAGHPEQIKTDESGNTHGPSFGLFQPDGSSEPAGGWAWINGDAVTYKNWSRFEPNNRKSTENYASFFGLRGAFPRSWNDVSGFGWAGYLIEIPPPN